MQIPKLTCEGCKGRDRIIRSLSEYIERLEKDEAKRRRKERDEKLDRLIEKTCGRNILRH